MKGAESTMNYVWEAALTAEEKGIDRKDLRFVPAENPSPYVELSFADLNTMELDEKQVEINPLYRFSAVFEKLFAPDNREYGKLREIFMDIYLHYVISTDLLSGMHKQEYYFWFMTNELFEGAFGYKAAEAMDLFDGRERRLIVTFLMGLYRSGYYEEIFRQLLSGLYENAILYAGRDRADSVYLYVGTRETDREQKRICFLTDTFLPVNMDILVFYDRHFGIIDVEETMQMDKVLLI